MENRVTTGISEDRFTGAIESQTARIQVPATWRQRSVRLPHQLF